MTTAAKKNRDPASLTAEERRQCKRLPMTFPIEVSGIDASGNAYHDLTITKDVSAEGCRFDLLRPVSRGDEVTIRLTTREGKLALPDTALRFQIVWVEWSDFGWSVGAQKLQPENLWHMAFPKIPPHSQR